MLKFARKCDACGKGMNEGYVVDDGCEYFCTDVCLHTKYTAEEWAEMFAVDIGYWTEWDAESEIENSGEWYSETGELHEVE
jgi:hypothetical protein